MLVGIKDKNRFASKRTFFIFFYNNFIFFYYSFFKFLASKLYLCKKILVLYKKTTIVTIALVKHKKIL